MQGGGRAALSVEDAGAQRARGSCAGAAKGCGGDARGHIPPPRRRGSAFRPSPPVSARLRSGTASRGLGRPGDSRKSFIVSPRPPLRVRKAFAVSRETKLHVGSTSGRSDVTAHAVRQRRAGLSCHACLGPRAGRKPESSRRGLRGVRGWGLSYTECCVRERRGAKDSVGAGGLES